MAYITRHELPPPEPAMSSIDAESPDPLNQTTLPPKSKVEDKQNKTVFIPTDPVQQSSQKPTPTRNESFSYQNYQSYHPTKPSQSNSQPTKVSQSVKVVRSMYPDSRLSSQEYCTADSIYRYAT